MAASQTATNKDSLSTGGKLFLAALSLASSPGYLAALILVAAYIVELCIGDHSHSRSVLLEFLGTAPAVLALLGILSTPVALLMAFVGSFVPMSWRGKVLAWTIVLGGFVGWAFSFGMIWYPYAHQR